MNVPEATVDGRIEDAGYRVAGVLLRALPRLPRALSHRLLRRMQRHYRPDPALARGLEIDEAVYGAVRVVWLERRHRDAGSIVYLHGGAYIGGPGQRQYRWLTTVQRSTGFAAAAIIYRMPPDHPYPAAVDDATSTIERLLDHGELAPGRWVLAGDSAGGGMAIAALRRLRAAGRSMPAALVLSSPWVDLALESPEIEAMERKDALLDRSWVCWAARLYAGGRPLDDPELSPIHGSFEGFPPVHLDVGTCDMLLPDARALHDRLRRDGVAVEYLEQAAAPHAHAQLRGDEQSARTTAAQVRWISRWMRRAELASPA